MSPDALSCSIHLEKYSFQVQDKRKNFDFFKPTLSDEFCGIGKYKYITGRILFYTSSPLFNNMDYITGRILLYTSSSFSL